jgi:hypothetical protein
VDGTARNDLIRPDDDYYVKLALEAYGDRLTPAIADDIRQIAWHAKNDKFKGSPIDEALLEQARGVLEFQGRSKDADFSAIRRLQSIGPSGKSTRCSGCTPRWNRSSVRRRGPSFLKR